MLPPLYWGVGGGHKAYDSTIMMEEHIVYPGLLRTFDRPHEMGFKVIVAITGHYPSLWLHRCRTRWVRHHDLTGRARPSRIGDRP